MLSGLGPFSDTLWNERGGFLGVFFTVTFKKPLFSGSNMTVSGYCIHHHMCVRVRVHVRVCVHVCIAILTGETGCTKCYLIHNYEVYLHCLALHFFFLT